MVLTIGVVGQQCVSGRLGEAFEWRATEAMKDVVTCDKSRGAGNML